MKIGAIGNNLWPWRWLGRKVSSKKKICIIGNSHVGALKRAWDTMEGSTPDVEFDFFAMRGAGMNDLIVEGNKLVGGTSILRAAMQFTSGGKDTIVPEDYDGIILYGLRFTPYLSNKNVVISDQVRKTAICDSARISISTDVLRKIRQISQVKIYIGHTPLRATVHVKRKRKPVEYLRDIAEANEIFYRSQNAVIIPQPRVTIVNGRFTDPVYTEGSKRLAIGDSLDDMSHSGRDMIHMNDEFGKLWLSDFLTKI